MSYLSENMSHNIIALAIKTLITESYKGLRRFKWQGRKAEKLESCSLSKRKIHFSIIKSSALWQDFLIVIQCKAYHRISVANSWMQMANNSTSLAMTVLKKNHSCLTKISGLKSPDL